MKTRISWGAMLLIILCPLLAMSAGGASKIYPLPRQEAAEVISSWLQRSGFTVSMRNTANGGIGIRAEKGIEEWTVDVAPHSPLACEVSARYRSDRAVNPDKVQSLWSYLSGYAKGTVAFVSPSSPNVPAAVIERSGFVVCISAMKSGEPLQFSGFMVDTSGLILCTAHNLDGVRDVTVSLPDKRTIPGRIIKADGKKDLALVDVDMSFPAAVSVESGTGQVSMGKKLFSVGCPENHSATVYAGYVDSPPRLMGKEKLWQVSMKVFPGSSGSPVFDEKGAFVAVVKGRRRGTDSIGFLIPGETVNAFIREKAQEK